MNSLDVSYPASTQDVTLGNPNELIVEAQGLVGDIASLPPALKDVCFRICQRSVETILGDSQKVVAALRQSSHNADILERVIEQERQYKLLLQQVVNRIPLTSQHYDLEPDISEEEEVQEPVLSEQTEGGRGLSDQELQIQSGPDSELCRYVQSHIGVLSPKVLTKLRGIIQRNEAIMSEHTARFCRDMQFINSRLIRVHSVLEQEVDAKHNLDDQVQRIQDQVQSLEEVQQEVENNGKENKRTQERVRAYHTRIVRSRSPIYSTLDWHYQMRRENVVYWLGCELVDGICSLFSVNPNF